MFGLPAVVPVPFGPTRPLRIGLEKEQPLPGNRRGSFYSKGSIGCVLLTGSGRSCGENQPLSRITPEAHQTYAGGSSATVNSNYDHKPHFCHPPPAFNRAALLLETRGFTLIRSSASTPRRRRENHSGAHTPDGSKQLHFLSERGHLSFQRDFNYYSCNLSSLSPTVLQNSTSPHQHKQLRPINICTSTA